jgi:hypothetical protein
MGICELKSQFFSAIQGDLLNCLFVHRSLLSAPAQRENGIGRKQKDSFRFGWRHAAAYSA